MIKHLRIFLAAFVLFSIFVENNTCKAQQINLANAGFEDNLNNWTCQASGGAVTDYSIDSLDAMEGTKSMKVVLTTLGANYWNIQAFNTAFSGELSGTYVVSLWMKASTANQKVNFNVSKATANYDSYAGLSSQVITTSWKQYSFTVPVLTTPLNDLRVCFNFLTVGTYWIDGITVTPTVVASSAVLPAGNKLQIVFTENMIDPQNESSIPLIIKADGKTYSISSIERAASNFAQYNIVLNDYIKKGSTVGIEYYPGTLATTTGKEIPAFTYTPVNNSKYISSSVNTTTAIIETYPNPCSDRLNIRLANFSSGTYFELSDLSGKTVLQSILQAEESSLNIASLAKGIYLMRITSKDGSTIHTSKIVKL